jgi:hypothetical protein
MTAKTQRIAHLLSRVFPQPRSNKFTAFNSNRAMDADAKDDLTHTWSDPAGGPIPASSILHVGLMQDVWDWSVVSAQVRDITGMLTNAPLISWQPWSNSFFISLSTPGFVAEGKDRFTGNVIITAHGLRIENSDTPVFLSRFGIAIVDDLNLDLNDLNHNTLDELVQLGRMQFFDESIFLDSSQDFTIMFDGIAEGLPTAAFAGNDFLSLNRPDLVDHELFVYALGQNGGVTAGSYGLIGTPPITGAAAVPEPPTLLLLATSIVFVLGLHQMRREDGRRRRAPYSAAC